MNKITYVQGDQLVLIDGLGFNGTYDTTPNLYAIQWTPSSYTIEWDTGRPTTESGAYPYQQHIDEWNRQRGIAEEAIIIRDEEVRLEYEAAAEHIVKLEALKSKVALIMTDLSDEELRMLVGLTIEKVIPEMEIAG